MRSETLRALNRQYIAPNAGHDIKKTMNPVGICQALKGDAQVQKSVSGPNTKRKVPKTTIFVGFSQNVSRSVTIPIGYRNGPKVTNGNPTSLRSSDRCTRMTAR